MFARAYYANKKRSDKRPSIQLDVNYAATLIVTEVSNPPHEALISKDPD